MLAHSTLPTVVLLLTLAGVVSVTTRWARIPYTVALVLIGIGLAAVGVVPRTALSPDVVLPLLLPPLLFEAAFALRWRDLAPVAPAILTLATVGVLLSAAATGAAFSLVARLTWSTSLLFGVLVAATDPVAVVAFFAQARVAPRLRALVEGESLVNDGTVVVLVGILSVVVTGRVNPREALASFGWVVLGGLVVGTLIGFVGSVLARGTSDYLVEATLTVAVAYGSYLLGEQVQASGVLAVVSAGSVFGNFGRRFGLSPATEEAIDSLWRFLAFVANSLVFLLLGSAVVPEQLLHLAPLILLGSVAALLGRALVTYGLGAALGAAVPLGWRHVLFWGGIRGALPVVVAIALTDEQRAPASLSSLVLGVVVVTLVIQGLTLEAVLERILPDRSRSPE